MDELIDRNCFVMNYPYGNYSEEVISYVKQKGCGLEMCIRDRSKASDSLWMKMGGDSHHQTKVVDGILYVKSDMAMLGYLNAEAPFDEDGWYNTGDHVEVDGEYYLIQGRCV